MITIAIHYTCKHHFKINQIKTMRECSNEIGGIEYNPHKYYQSKPLYCFQDGNFYCIYKLAVFKNLKYLGELLRLENNSLIVKNHFNKWFFL